MHRRTGVLARPRRTGRSRLSWRWAVVAALVTVLGAAPALAGVRSGGPADVAADELLSRVQGSATVAFTGYGESRGRLVLPDVRELGDLTGLFGGTARTRLWWRGPADWRIDALTLVGERDTVTDRDGSWSWDSADARAVRLEDRLDVRLPQPGDLTPPLLGRRLAGAADVEPSRLPSRRVAGRSAAGLRLTPRRPAETTVRHVDMWVDQTGLPLQVEVHAGEAAPSLESVLLDVDLEMPDPLGFSPPDDADVLVEQAPDIAALSDRYAPFSLPPQLAGLPRRQRVTSLPTGGGVGTYGDGLTTLVVVPLRRDDANRAVRRIQPDGVSETVQLPTPLVNAVISSGEGPGYLIAGTVPMPLVERALAQLRAEPPPWVNR